MSDIITLETNADELVQKFRNLPDTVRAGIHKRLRGALLVVETRIRTRNASTGPSSVKFSGGRSGLSSRLTSFVRSNAEIGIEAAIGFRKTRGFPYELAQETGAKAKPGKAMAIPITPQARATGSPRKFAFPLVLIKTAKSAILAEKLGGTKILPHYVLVKSIPPRLGFRRTVQDNAGYISEQIVEGMADGMKKA